MKTYIAPEIELIRFSAEEALMASVTDLVIKGDSNGAQGETKGDNVDLW